MPRRRLAEEVEVGGPHECRSTVRLIWRRSLVRVAADHRDRHARELVPLGLIVLV
ncbi:MAG TPA: hypothetical protein VNM48_08325 [Chloroflexota bacterium]|nr:hypothetical protein [Chloroflexota bacterium]